MIEFRPKTDAEIKRDAAKAKPPQVAGTPDLAKSTRRPATEEPVEKR